MQLDVEEADAIESSMQRNAPKLWKKFPDKPLGEVIVYQHARRIESHGRKARAGAKRGAPQTNSDGPRAGL